MSKIEKPVKRERGDKDIDCVYSYNIAIEQCDKYHEQEMKKQELLRVELYLSTSFLERELEAYKRIIIQIGTAGAIADKELKYLKQKLSIEKVIEREDEI